MGINASNKTGFTLIPQGVTTAVCIRMYDIGTHYDEKFKKSSRKVIITWETPPHTISKDGKDLPMSISREFSLNLGEKSNLRHILESWRGKPFTPEQLESFDITKVLGVPCMIQIVHETKNGKERAKVTNVMAVPAGLIVPPASMEPKYFAFDDNFDGTIPDFVPEWIKKKIIESDEYRTFHGETSDADDPPIEDVPLLDASDMEPF